MKCLFYTGLFIILFALNANAAILIISQNGNYVPATSLSAAVAGASAVGKTIVVTSAYNIDNVTVPSTIALEISKGGLLTVNSGKTLTINGPFNAGAWSAFSKADATAKIVFGPTSSVSELKPEWFGVGTAAQNAAAIQSILTCFIDSAFSSRTIVLSKMYDITGYTITLPFASEDRRATYFKGQNNGGLLKSDAGFMLTATNRTIGDLFFQNVTFNGNISVPCDVFDCNKLIRFRTDNCMFSYVHSVYSAIYDGLHSTTGYIQSVRSTGDSFLYMCGPVINAGGIFDSVWSDFIMENSGNSDSAFLNHMSNGTYKSLNGVFIHDGLIEGLTLSTNSPIKLGSAIIAEIKNLYFEQNKGSYEIEFLTAATEVDGVEIANITSYVDGANAVGRIALIKWNAYPYKCKTENLSANVPVHDLRLVPATAIIESVNDWSSGNYITATYNITNVTVNTGTNVATVTYNGTNQYVIGEFVGVTGVGGATDINSIFIVETIPASNQFTVKLTTAQSFTSGGQVSRTFYNYIGLTWDRTTNLRPIRITAGPFDIKYLATIISVRLTEQADYFHPTIVNTLTDVIPAGNIVSHTCQFPFNVFTDDIVSIKTQDVSNVLPSKVTATMQYINPADRTQYLIPIVNFGAVDASVLVDCTLMRPKLTLANPYLL